MLIKISSLIKHTPKGGVYKVLCQISSSKGNLIGYADIKSEDVYFRFTDDFTAFEEISNFYEPTLRVEGRVENGESIAGKIKLDGAWKAVEWSSSNMQVHFS